MKAVVAYYPSTNKPFAIYDSIEEARSEVKFLNLFSGMAQEKLEVGVAELTEEEYAGLRGETDGNS